MIIDLSQNDTLSASESLYGFAGWLTSQEIPVILSRKHDAGIAAELVDKFCKVNNLADPSPRWTRNLIHPDQGQLPGVLRRLGLAGPAMLQNEESMKVGPVLKLQILPSNYPASIHTTPEGEKPFDAIAKLHCLGNISAVDAVCLATSLVHALSHSGPAKRRGFVVAGPVDDRHCSSRYFMVDENKTSDKETASKIGD